jgi:hypothetical protein
VRVLRAVLMSAAEKPGAHQRGERFQRRDMRSESGQSPARVTRAAALVLLGVLVALWSLGWAARAPAAAQETPTTLTVSSSGQWDSTYSNTFNGEQQSQQIHFTWSSSGTFMANGTEIGTPTLVVTGTESDVNIIQTVGPDTCTGTLSAKPASQWLSTLIAGNASASTVTGGAGEPGTFDSPAEFIASAGSGNCGAFEPEYSRTEPNFGPYVAAAGGEVMFPTSQRQLSQSFPVSYSDTEGAATYTLMLSDTVTASVTAESCSVGTAADGAPSAQAASDGSPTGGMFYAARGSAEKRSSPDPLGLGAPGLSLDRPRAAGSGGSCGTYVALGDSYSTGQTGDNGCLRSNDGYPIVYDPDAIFKACSGATIADIKKSQLNALSDRTKIVSITAGGDDAQLFHSLIECVVHGTTPYHCQFELDKALHSSKTSLASVQRGLGSLFATIRAKAKNAKVYALGYPTPVPRLVPRSCVAPLRAWFLGGLFGLRQQDAELFWDVIEKLNKAVSTAAKAAHVKYVPPFPGHTICSQDPWFGELTAVPIGLILHPNQQGNIAMAKALRKSAGPPPS